jgi:hypothetical protein
MAHFSPGEKFELAAIPLAAVVAFVVAPRPAAAVEAGELIAGAALVVLLQGFCRDLWLLARARRRPAAGAARAAPCLCVESALGLTGIAAGIGLTGIGFTRLVALSPLALALGTGATMFAAYGLKDFVFEWSPWKIYREKDHTQVIFRWRR